MTTTDILEKIVALKKRELVEQKKQLPIEEIKDNLNRSRSPLSFERKLQEAIVIGKMALIAEIKKASPSKGLIREDFDPVEIAAIYENCGASAISVLTDEHFFQGRLEYLQQVVNTVKLPVLRKDFIIDPYQIYQSRYFGADMILLISSILTYSELKEFYSIAGSLGMQCLIETHTKEDFLFHIENQTRIIGINNRNLKTFKTDINHTKELIKGVKICKSFVISESGISTFEDLLMLSNWDVSGVLIGESFMREKDISAAVKRIMGNN